MRRALWRRVIWNIYAWPITLFIAFVTFAVLKRMEPLALLDWAISFPSLIALHLHIWDKRLLPAKFWKPYAFSFVVLDLLYHFLVYAIRPGEHPHVVLIVVLILHCPLYIGAFRYALRKWDGHALRIRLTAEDFVVRKIPS